MTPKQKACFDAIAAGIAANGYAPSYRELMVAVGVKSASGICDLVDKLEAQGWITRRAHCARTIEIVVRPSIDQAARQVVREWRRGALTHKALWMLEGALGPERAQ